MHRLALAGIAVLVAAMLAVLLVQIRGGSEQKPEVPAPAARREEAGGHAAALGAVPKPVRMRGEPGAAEPEEEPGDEAEQEPAEPREMTPAQWRIFLSQDVPQKILQAAAACYHGQEGQNEKMTVGYDLRFSGGVGTLEQVSVKESDLEMPDLEQCILVALRSLKIRDRTAPDLVQRDESIDISVLAIKKRARGMGVPLDPK